MAAKLLWLKCLGRMCLVNFSFWCGVRKQARAWVHVRTCLEHDEAIGLVPPPHDAFVLRTLQHPAITASAYSASHTLPHTRRILIELAHLRDVSRVSYCDGVSISIGRTKSLELAADPRPIWLLSMVWMTIASSTQCRGTRQWR